MRLKICHIIPTLDQGGAEKQMALVATHLDRERFAPHVVTLTRGGPRETMLVDAGVPVHAIEKRGKLDPRALARLTRTLRSLAPDVVHTWLFAGNSYGRVAARRAGVPAIIAGERCVDPWKRWWHHAIDRRLLSTTDTVVTNSTGVVEFYGGHGIPESKFSVIPNAIDGGDRPRISREELFRRLGIPPREKIIAAIGRLWPQKGYRDLIWSAELLHATHRDVILVILGDGPDRAALQRYRDQVGAKDSVRFVGHRSDAVELLSAVDLLWNGSLYEGQSNTILEAMAAAIPVVASDIPGNRDLVVDDVTGYLVGLGDIAALVRKTYLLLRDDSRRSAMGLRARERAIEEFSIERMVAAHERLYEEVFNAKSRGHQRG